MFQSRALQNMQAASTASAASRTAVSVGTSGAMAGSAPLMSSRSRTGAKTSLRRSGTQSSFAAGATQADVYKKRLLGE